jgi:hypothetical protein
MDRLESEIAPAVNPRRQPPRISSSRVANQTHPADIADPRLTGPRLSLRDAATPSQSHLELLPDCARIEDKIPGLGRGFGIGAGHANQDHMNPAQQAGLVPGPQPPTQCRS